VEKIMTVADITNLKLASKTPRALVNHTLTSFGEASKPELKVSYTFKQFQQSKYKPHTHAIMPSLKRI
jgi:hypothetical protein